MTTEISDSHHLSPPIIALTMGDAAGIGPEVLIRAAVSEELRSRCRLVAVGHPEVLARAARLTGSSLQIDEVAGFDSLRDRMTSPNDAAETPILLCVKACEDDVADVAFGKVDRRAGQAAYDCLVAATKAALAAQIDGICTAPL
ncbi:MAG: 4-hydroxythreonine-4-phosphate dehydrogenase PdxA, partial [Rhodopirellula sp.]|nr:4-hydroxythreonine-4-phosphate dehydrogenase PdxA [Rhodopirellula sp.]